MDASARSTSARIARPSSPGLDGLRVALVHDWLTGMRGGEKCLEVLCKAFPNATLHTLFHRRGALSPPIERMAIRTSPLHAVPGIARHYRKLLPVMPLAARTWNVREVDLVVSLSHCVAKSIRVPEGIPHVCYCFTPMRYAWQGRDSYLASWSDRPIRRALASTLLNRLRKWDRASSSGVTHFIAISETIRGRIRSSYRRESQIIRPPVDTDFYTPGDRPRDDFYLCVSALVPYKRVEQAVEACTRLGRKLIVIGEGPERARLERDAGASVQFLGWQSDEVIRDHYQRCRALLFPGEEDFGIVPIEALACGAPVIALGRGGVPETVDNAIGRTYDEPTAEGLADAIRRWEEDGAPFQAELARSRAESMSLPHFRDRLLTFLGDVVSGQAPLNVNVPPAPHLSIQSGPASSGPMIGHNSPVETGAGLESERPAS